MYRIKRLTTIDEMRALQKIEGVIWNTDVTPIHQTYSAANNGGMVLGAYNGEELVGFQYSFPGYKDGRTYLCSHMLGILPAYQKSGVGKILKEAQRNLALEMGYSLIVWTYDPLESVNSYLNLHKLRGIGARYYENYYGDMNDALNRGLPSDRLLVQWWIDSDHVKGNHTTVSFDPEHSPIRTELDQQHFLTITSEQPIDFEQPYVFLPIPDHFQAIRKAMPDLALQWRMVIRNKMQQLLQHGYIAIDLLRAHDQKSCNYVFSKQTELVL